MVSLFIFPSDPFKPSRVDPEYDIEARYFEQRGISIAVWNMDEPEKAPRFLGAAPRDVCYARWRGWMLNPRSFSALVSHLYRLNIPHSLHQQRQMHYARHWIDACEKNIPITTLSENPVHDWDRLVARHGLPVFIKDEVKSLSTPFPCHDASDAARCMSLIEDHRGVEHGDWIVRSWIQLNKSSPEIRRWCVDGHWFGSAVDTKVDSTPSFEACARQVEKTVAREFQGAWVVADYAQDQNGKWWLMEIGDADVSGWKEWTMSDAQRVLDAMASSVLAMEQSMNPPSPS